MAQYWIELIGDQTVQVRAGLPDQEDRNVLLVVESETPVTFHDYDGDKVEPIS